MKKSERKWNDYLEALGKFADSNGHTRVPHGHFVSTPNGPLKLGSWVTYIRAKGRSGKLISSRKSELESIPEWTWDSRKPGPESDPRRDEEMIRAREQGRSLQSIALQWEVSRQRVHQIVKHSRSLS